MIADVGGVIAQATLPGPIDALRAAIDALGVSIPSVSPELATVGVLGLALVATTARYAVYGDRKSVV